MKRLLCFLMSWYEQENANEWRGAGVQSTDFSRAVLGENGAVENTVLLTVNEEPTMTGARTVSYKPITNESDLIYLDWVTANRKKVSDMTGGRVGYIHIPDIGTARLKSVL